MLKIRVPWLTPVSRRRGSAARLEEGGGDGLSRSSASLRNGLKTSRASRRFFAGCLWGAAADAADWSYLGLPPRAARHLNGALARGYR